MADNNAATSILPFIAAFESVIIATIDAEGLPFTSYAPYLYHDHRYYIFISDIATHARNLKEQQKASLLFIEDESKSGNIFARRRISLQCSCSVIPRGKGVFETVMEHFGKRFEMISMLMQMQDFNLYEMRPLKGEATFGFGEAYCVGGEHMETLLPRSGAKGHRTRE